MTLEEILPAEAIRWLERKSEVVHDFVLPKIKEMPTEIAAVVLTELHCAYLAEGAAGLSGERHDGGAGERLRAVEAFVHGWYKKIPREWDAQFRQLRRERDPEWPEYQRLKKKFEGG
jgi:hypothetical protein